MAEQAGRPTIQHTHTYTRTHSHRLVSPAACWLDFWPFLSCNCVASHSPFNMTGQFLVCVCVLGKWSQIPRINSDNDDAVASCLTCPATAAMHWLSTRLDLAWVDLSRLGCGCLIGHYKLYSSVRGFSSSLLRKFSSSFYCFLLWVLLAEKRFSNFEARTHWAVCKCEWKLPFWEATSFKAAMLCPLYAPSPLTKSVWPLYWT